MTTGADTPVWTAGVRREVLPNGLTVLVQPVDGSPAAAVVSQVRAGFFDEPDEVAGISHVLEHMYFKGTPALGVGEIARTIRAAGGYVNAATSYDYTSYYAVLPVRELATAVSVQAEGLRHASIDADELARELQVIIEEAHRKLDTPHAVAHETLHQLLFDHHRIRRWRIGTDEVLSRLTRDDLVGYYRSRYVPSRTIVAVAGGVDPDAALALIRRHYGDWSADPTPVPSGPAEPTRTGVRTRALRGDVEQAHLALGWRAVPALDPDTIALDVAAAVLSLGRSSWLYRRLRNPGLVSSIGSWNFSPREVGVFSVSASLDPSRLDPVLRGIAAAVAQLAEQGPAPDDLERVRTLLRARWASRFESAEGRAAELALAESQAGIDLLEREWQRLGSLTTTEVRDAVRRHLVADGVAAVLYLPREAEVQFPPERLQACFAVPADRIQPAGSAPVPAAPRPVPATTRRVDQVHHLALPGVDLLLRRRPGTPTSSVGVHRVRHDWDPPDQAGLAALAVRSAVRGAGPWDAEQLADRLERLGGGVSPSVGSETWGFSTRVLAEHTAASLAMLDIIMHQPRFAAEEVTLERGLLEDDARLATDDMYRYPIQLAMRSAFGPQGPGLPTLGLPATVAGLMPEQVRVWHQAAIGRGRLTVVAVGDFEPERLAAALAGIFGGRSAADRLEPPGGLIWPGPHDDRAVVETRDKAQTALAMIFPGPGRLDTDRHGAEVWAAWAGGLGGRLFESLRDRRSLAYTVTASSWQRRTGGGLLAYIATSPGREAEAREEMLRELEASARTAPDAGRVAAAAGYLVGQTEVRRQSAGAMAGEVLGAFLSGTGLEELPGEEAAYRAVTADDVRALAERYLQRPLRAEGVVRGRSPA